MSSISPRAGHGEPAHRPRSADAHRWGSYCWFLVFDDADLDLAVREAMIAEMRLGGPSCIGTNRFLVQEAIADTFAAAMGERMAAARVGQRTVRTPLSARWPTTGRWTRSATSPRTPWLVVPLSSPRQRSLTGPGHFAAPTVLDHAPGNAAIMRGSLRTRCHHPPVVHRGRGHGGGQQHRARPRVAPDGARTEYASTVSPPASSTPRCPAPTSVSPRPASTARRSPCTGPRRSRRQSAASSPTWPGGVNGTTHVLDFGALARSAFPA